MMVPVQHRHETVSVILERVRTLYNIDSFRADVRKVLAEQMLSLFQRYPQLIVDLRKELLEFVGTRRNVGDGEYKTNTSTGIWLTREDDLGGMPQMPQRSLGGVCIHSISAPLSSRYLFLHCADVCPDFCLV